MHTFFNYCLLRDTERNKEKAKGISFSQEATGFWLPVTSKGINH